MALGWPMERPCSSQPTHAVRKTTDLGVPMPDLYSILGEYGHRRGLDNDHGAVLWACQPHRLAALRQWICLISSWRCRLYPFLKTVEFTSSLRSHSSSSGVSFSRFIASCEGHTFSSNSCGHDGACCPTRSERFSERTSQHRAYFDCSSGKKLGQWTRQCVHLRQCSSR